MARKHLPCSYDGCQNRQHARGYCDTHDRQQKRTGQMWPTGTYIRNRSCTFDGCTRPHHGRGYCDGHFQQLRRGAPLAPLRRHAPKPKGATLPAAPLLAYAEANNLDSPIRRDRKWLTVEEVDVACVKFFKVHPWFVYGDAWWDEEAMEEAA